MSPSILLPLFLMWLLTRRGSAAAEPMPAPAPVPGPRPQPTPQPKPRPQPTPQPKPRPQATPTVSPAPVVVPTAAAPKPPVAPAPNVAPPAWPSATPAGLPPFPGSGWVPHPSPGKVAARASQLLSPLWSKGEGTHVIEKTAGDWVAFRAVKMGDKKGVVAYVPRGDVHDASEPAVPAPAVAPPKPRPQTAPTAAVPAQGTILTSTAPPEPDEAPEALPAPAPRPNVPPPPPPEASTGRPQRPVGFSGATVRNGNYGPSVIYLQQLLGFHGYPVMVDGKFGNETKTAVTAFQRAEGLGADGIVGPKTWGALES